MRNKKLVNTLIPLILVFILSSWIMVNTDFRVGGTYGVLILGSIVIYSVLKMNNAKNLIHFKLDSTFGLGLMLSFLMLFVLKVIPEIGVLIPQTTYSLTGLQNFTYSVVLASVVEEYMFRGWMLTLFRNLMPTFHAVLITSFLFSIYHFAVLGNTEILSFIGAMLFGLLASAATIYTKNLSSGILMHSTSNAIQYFKLI